MHLRKNQNISNQKAEFVFVLGFTAVILILSPPLYLSHRETMLQALRFVIQGAGSKVDPTIRKSITTTLLGMLGHDEV